MVGIPAPKTRVWRISRRATTYEKKKIVARGENLNPNTVQIDRLPEVKHTCDDLKQGKKKGIFKKLSKHWLGSPHLKRECAASLNPRELTTKKVNMSEISNPNTVQLDRLPELKHICVNLGEG